jgi:hypothetical protein
MPTAHDIEDKPRTGQINYRVKSMKEVLTHLKNKRVAIEKTAEYPDYGTLRGSKIQMIELWEPSKGE